MGTRGNNRAWRTADHTFMGDRLFLYLMQRLRGAQRQRSLRRLIQQPKNRLFRLSTIVRELRGILILTSVTSAALVLLSIHWWFAWYGI